MEGRRLSRFCRLDANVKVRLIGLPRFRSSHTSPSSPIHHLLGIIDCTRAEVQPDVRVPIPDPRYIDGDDEDDLEEQEEFGEGRGRGREE